MPPRVSIIIPVYNGEKYLRESLDSILAQTYTDTEVMVWDDASTDATPAILETYADRLRVVRQPKNRGIYDNVNDGIAMARGDYIAVYHADDVYLPGMVAGEVDFLDRYPEAGGVFTNISFLGPAGEEIGRLELPDELRGSRPWDFPAVLNGLLRHKNHFLMCPTAMVRASVHRDVGVYRQDLFGIFADLDMWLRISRSYSIGILEERLLRYRHFHDSASFLYHKLRTEPELYFELMDRFLDEGARAVATADALAAHEAHRAEDLLMVTTSDYILDRRQDAARMLSHAQPARILGSPQIQRGRMLVLFLLLHVLVRLPRVGPLANAFRRRFHDKGPQRKR